MEKALEFNIANFKISMKKKLGSGAFGDIFLAVNTRTNEEVAIKIESVKAKSPQLQNETKILKFLEGGAGIPSLHYFLLTNEYNFMVMDLLGPSLEELFVLCKKTFDLKTVVMVADQMLSRIEYIHSRHLIHRDIKPENFLIGLKSNRSTIFLVDFGLAKRFRDPSNGEHIPYRDGKHMTGTVRYASIYTHLGVEQSRRDDLESLVYNMLYFYGGELPWQGIKAKNQREKYKKIMEIKISLTPNKICERYPFEISTMLEYIRSLQFEEKPDYSHIRSILLSIHSRLEIREDSGIFYWERYLSSRSQYSRVNSYFVLKKDHARLDEE